MGPIKGAPYDASLVKPGEDGSRYSYWNRETDYVVPGRGDGVDLTSNGLVVRVMTGEVSIMGRYINLTEDIFLTCPANKVTKLVCRINLNLSNTVTGSFATGDYDYTLNQAWFEITDDPNVPRQEDLNNDGKRRDLVLATLTSTSNSVTISKNSSAYADPNKKLDDLISALQTAVSNLSTSLTSLTNAFNSFVTSTNNTLTSLQTQITNNLNNLTTLINNVKNDLQSKIDTINNTIAAIQTELLGIHADITSINNDILAINTSISNIQSDISNINTRLNVIDSVLSVITNQISALQLGLIALTDSFNAFVAATDAAIIDLQTQIDTINQTLTLIDTELGDIFSEITNLNGRLGTVETTIVSMASDIQTNYDNILILDSAISILRTDYESYAASNDANITTINSTLVSHGSRLTTLEGDLTTLTSTVTAINTALTNLTTTVNNLSTSFTNFLNSIPSTVMIGMFTTNVSGGFELYRRYTSLNNGVFAPYQDAKLLTLKAGTNIGITTTGSSLPYTYTINNTAANPGNGKLSMKIDSTEYAYFTANQATDTTATIPHAGSTARGVINLQEVFEVSTRIANRHVWATSNLDNTVFSSSSSLPSTNGYANGTMGPLEDYDYAIVIDSNETWLYSYKSGSWMKEYRINESPLTSQQLAAINSTITLNLVDAVKLLLTKVVATALSSELVANAIRVMWTEFNSTAFNAQRYFDIKSSDNSLVFTKSGTTSPTYDVKVGPDVVGKGDLKIYTADYTTANLLGTFNANSDSKVEFVIPVASPTVFGVVKTDDTTIKINADGKLYANNPGKIVYGTYSSFPASGAANTLYVASDKKKGYYWNGSAYVNIEYDALTIYSSRPSTGVQGALYFNTSTNNFEYWNGSAFTVITLNAPGNGTLTITVAGTSAGTFTANQSTASTINIPQASSSTAGVTKFSSTYFSFSSGVVSPTRLPIMANFSIDFAFDFYNTTLDNGWGDSICTASGIIPWYSTTAPTASQIMSAIQTNNVSCSCTVPYKIKIPGTSYTGTAASLNYGASNWWIESVVQSGSTNFFGVRILNISGSSIVRCTVLYNRST